MNTYKLLLTLSLTAICLTATAQWQWIDKDGRQVFSDRAPPPEIADKSIVKRPASRTPSSSSPSEAPVTEGSVAPVISAGNANVSNADKELEAKKKEAVEALIARKKADEERVTKAKIENCARAKQAKSSLESGVRIARTNAAGEREFMDDAARTAEGKRIQGIIASDCN